MTTVTPQPISNEARAAVADDTIPGSRAKTHQSYNEGQFQLNCLKCNILNNYAALACIWGWQCENCHFKSNLIAKTGSNVNTSDQLYKLCP